MSRRALRLTFDDGPDPRWTPLVLSRLAKFHAPATFFLLAGQMRRHPGLVQTILSAGHLVGLHGDQHLDHSVATEAAITVDTRRALSTFHAVGVEPTLWRLPWGRTGPATQRLAEEHGLEIVDWDIDTHDWRGDGWNEQPAQVKRCPQDGGVVLMHDALGPGSRRDGCANTLQLVEALLSRAARHGTPTDVVSAQAVVAAQRA